MHTDDIAESLDALDGEIGNFWCDFRGTRKHLFTARLRRAMQLAVASRPSLLARRATQLAIASSTLELARRALQLAIASRTLFTREASTPTRHSEFCQNSELV